MSPWLLLAALIVGAACGAAGHAWWLNHRMRQAAPELIPADAPHVMDLLRRAHGALAACLVLPETDPVLATGEIPPPGAVLERALATARLSLMDGREHVVREGNVIVAVGDGYHGSAVVLAFDEAGPGDVQAVSGDLRRFLAELKVERRREFGRLGDISAAPDWIAAGSDSVEALGFGLCEWVRAVAGRPTAVVVRDPSVPQASVVAISHTADRRLLGIRVSAESAAGRACSGDIPVAASSVGELFGTERADRRRGAEPGIAFPLRDGPEGVGALVIFGPSDSLEPSSRERIAGYAVDAGPRLAHAMQVRVAENLAETDELTRRPKGRAWERAMRDRGGGESGALLCVDLDHFKQVNDSHGHAAGDAVLKHVARIFREALRDGDVAARIGGEEFAVWLPDTPLAPALEVAERIRAALEASFVPWAGQELRLTCSIGVGARPDTVSDTANLFPAADAALYQAKAAGRNQVKAAEGTGSRARR